MKPPLLELHRVSYSYPDGSVGLQDCTLTVRRGSRDVLIGANGSGKTTLFLHGNALLDPLAGIVRYAGQDVDYSRAGRRGLRSKVGMVFQNPDHQLFSASVQEDVSFGPLNLGLDMPETRQRVAAALQAVGMQEHADKPVHNLSFGQKKRVCIAGVLAMKPELLILDEPLAGLDHAMQVELLAVLDDLHAQGITLLLATHDIDFAYRWAERIHLMAGGRCVASLNAADLGEHAADLAGIGLPLPDIIGLHRGLAARGLVPDAPTPRHGADLFALLAANNKNHDSPCKLS